MELPKKVYVRWADPQDADEGLFIYESLKDLTANIDMSDDDDGGHDVGVYELVEAGRARTEVKFDKKKVTKK